MLAEVFPFVLISGSGRIFTCLACKNFMQLSIEHGSHSYITHWRSAMDGQQVHWETVYDSSDTSYRQMTWPPSPQWPTSQNRKSVFSDSPSRPRGLQSRLPTLQAVRGNAEPHRFPSTGELPQNSFWDWLLCKWEITGRPVTRSPSWLLLSRVWRCVYILLLQRAHLFYFPKKFISGL